MADASGYVPLPTPVQADPNFYRQGIEGLNALRDTQAKQAIAGIYQQSVDPATGQVDPAKFNLLISRNPQAAWAAGPAMQQQGTAASEQGHGVQEQVAAHRTRMDTMLGLMNGVLAKGGPVGIGDIQTALNQAHLSPTEAALVAQDANAAAGGDPNYDFTGWVKNHQAANLTAQQQISARTPSMTFHNIGGRLVPVDMNGQTNPNPGSLITTLSPGEATQIVKVDMGDGTTQQMPLSDAVTQLSKNPAMRILGPTTGGGGGGGATSLNAAGDSATRKAAEGGPPAAGTPGDAVAKRTHDFWISQGYSEPVVAGILAGGPGSESDFTPTAKGDGGTSYGQYQHHGERLANMQKYFNLPAGQMPTEQQQNQYAAWEISPQGPLAHVGAALKTAKTAAEAATIWTRDFGVPKDKSEIARRANGAQRFVGLYAGQPGQPQGQPPAASTAPPAPPAGPPGVQMGGAPPPPPGGAAGPYTGGGIGAALAPGGGGNPVVVRGTPLPAGRVSGDVGAMMQGVQLAQANPLQQGSGAMVAGPGAPTGNALAGPSVELPPQPGWGSAVGSYGAGPAPAAAPAARPAVPAAPAPVPVQPPAATPPPAPTIGRSAPPGYVEAQRVTAEASAKRSNELVNQLTASSTVKPILAEMEDVLTKSGGTGFGTAHISAFRQALERLGLTPAAVDVATPQAALETFKKLSAQLQGAQLGTVGGVPTDDRQSLIEASNPSVLNSTAGNKSIIHVLQGTQQAMETMGRAWMASPEYQKDPGGFDKWRTEFTAKDPTTGGQFDPRTFWLNNMPPDEQHAYLTNMTPKGRAEFKKNWAYARNKGWVEPLPGQPASAPGG